VAPPEGSLAAHIARALERRPEMAQLEAGLRARRALVKAKRAEARPDIYAGVVGSLSYAPNRDRLDNPYIYDLFNHVGATPVIGIRWQLASGVQPARVARAQAELEALVSKAAFAREGIPFQVAEAWHQAQAGRRVVRALEAASRSARRWRVVRADSAGLALLVEWMRAARRAGRPLRYRAIPPQMLAIARVSSLDQVLPLE